MRTTKRPTLTNKPIETIRHCGECILGEWVKDDHLDMKGEPIMVRCPFNKFLNLRSQKACKNGKF